MRRSVTLACVALAIAAPALAATPAQKQAADALCLYLSRAYTGNHFAECRDAGWDTAAGMEAYWVWFTQHGKHGRVVYTVARALADGSPTSFHVISARRFRARWHPQTVSALAA